MRPAPAGSAPAALLVALLVGCGGTAYGPDAPGPPADGAAADGGRYIRVIDPFPVFDAAGERYERPFLGGYDVPRPQLVDIDGDGDLDLFVQERTGELVFFENVGTPAAPRFEWRTDRWRGLDVGEWARFADLDGDGDFDLLAEQVYSYVKYYENVGTPEAPDFVQRGDSVRSAEGRPIFSDRQNIPNVADIDCDDVPDLFLGRADGTVARWELDGWDDAGAPIFRLVDERFEDIEIVAQIGGEPAGDAPDGQDAPDGPAPSVRHGANSMGLADWDGDGDVDLLWGDFFEPSVLLIENTGSCERPDLRNPPRPVRTVPGEDLLTSGYNVPVPVDWDGDGDLDLVVGVLGGAFNPNRTASSALQLWERTDAGPLRLVTDRLLGDVDLGSESAPGAGDFDGDGDLDLLVGNRVGAPPDAASLVFHFENRGTPGAPELHLVDTLRLGEGYHYVPVPWDADGDGLLDLVVGSWNEEVLLFLNRGTAGEPRWERQEEPLVTLTRGSHTTPALGDVDGDGRVDLVVGEASGQLNLYRNTGERRADGAPVFELVTDELYDAGRRSAPVLVDWDGDGDLDLVVGREAAGALLLLNDGSGGFTPAGDVLPDLPPYATPIFVDLDGDGDLDVLSGGLGGGLVWLENRGG